MALFTQAGCCDERGENGSIRSRCALVSSEHGASTCGLPAASGHGSRSKEAPGRAWPKSGRRGLLQDAVRRSRASSRRGHGADGGIERERTCASGLSSRGKAAQSKISQRAGGPSACHAAGGRMADRRARKSLDPRVISATMPLRKSAPDATREGQDSRGASRMADTCDTIHRGPARDRRNKFGVNPFDSIG